MYGSGNSVKVGGVFSVPVMKCVCPVERRRKKCGAERRFGDGSVVASVRLIAKHNIIAGNRRKEPTAIDHSKHHVRTVPQPSEFKTYPAESAAGAGGSCLDYHPVLRHGIQLVFFEKKRRKERHTCNIFIGLKHVGRKVHCMQNSAVLFVVPILIYAVFAHRTEKQLVSAVQIINIFIPEQLSRSAHLQLTPSRNNSEKAAVVLLLYPRKNDKGYNEANCHHSDRG